jgi:predicted O-methyltransferase YrrM
VLPDRVAHRLRTHREARALRRSDHPLIRAVGEALAHRADPAERDWADRIEAERARLESSRELLRTPLYDYSLDPAHDHVFEDTVGELCRRASKPRHAALALFALVRRLRPARALELGTAVGISAAYQGAALRLNGRGRLVTIDAAAARVEVARELLARLGLAGVVESRLGRFQDVVGEVAAGGGIGYAFVDGHHDEDATLAYLDLIQPALVPPGVVVFDDIAWSDGMARAWARLRADERAEASGEALGMGFCVYRCAP